MSPSPKADVLQPRSSAKGSIHSGGDAQNRTRSAEWFGGALALQVAPKQPEDYFKPLYRVTRINSSGCVSSSHIEYYFTHKSYVSKIILIHLFSVG